MPPEPEKFWTHADQQRIDVVISTGTDITIRTTNEVKMITLAKAPRACWVLDVDNDISVDLGEHKCRVKTNPHLE